MFAPPPLAVPSSLRQQPSTGLTDMVEALSKHRKQKKQHRQDLEDMKIYLASPTVQELLQFSSTNGTQNMVILYREIRHWKHIWTSILQQRRWKTTEARIEAFKHAGLVYFLLLDQHHSQRKVELPAKIMTTLVNMFSTLSFSPGRTASIRREERRLVLNRRSSLINTQLGDIVSAEPSVDDIDFTPLSNVNAKIKSRLGSLPARFDVHVWDQALNHIESILFETTWKAFTNPTTRITSVDTSSHAVSNDEDTAINELSRTTGDLDIADVDDSSVQVNPTSAKSAGAQLT